MSVKVFAKCPRCNGKGNIKCFAHVKAGVCFGCRLNVEDLVAPGDVMLEVTFDGKAVHGQVRSTGITVRMTDLATLPRREKIAKAAAEFAMIDNESGPHGLSFIKLVALARVSDPVLSGRILSALRERVLDRDEEQAEVEGLVAILVETKVP
jgi:hypothetical protein